MVPDTFAQFFCNQGTSLALIVDFPAVNRVLNLVVNGVLPCALPDTTNFRLINMRQCEELYKGVANRLLSSVMACFISQKPLDDNSEEEMDAEALKKSLGDRVEFAPMGDKKGGSTKKSGRGGKSGTSKSSRGRGRGRKKAG